MTTDRNWLRAMRLRGIDPCTSDKVARRARGIIVDEAIDRQLFYRSESLRLFNGGNTEASFWAARAMEDRAIELDCAVAEAKETLAGRKQVAKAIEAASEKRAVAGAEHLKWQALADAHWSKPQHSQKGKSDIAKLIDPVRWNTIRRHIKKGG